MGDSLNQGPKVSQGHTRSFARREMLDCTRLPPIGEVE